MARPAGKADLLERLFRLRRGEAGRAFSMFAYLMGVVSTFIITRNVRDTLFLSRADLSVLAYMYIAVAASVAPASYVYSRIADRSRRDQVIARSLVLFAAVLLVFFALLQADAGGRWIYPVLYIVVEIIGAISIIQFWTFAQDIYDSREAKRLFGFIGAGGVLSNITCGFAIQFLVPIIGAEALLLAGAVLLFACVALVRSIGRGAAAELDAVRVQPKKSAIGVRADTRTLQGNRHLELIAAMVAVTFLTVSIVDYQFKVIAKSAYTETELSAFFGRFFAYTGIIASVMQFFVTARLLERRGIALSLALLPAGIAIGAASMLLPMLGTFFAVMIAKGAENIFRYTVNDASTQLLYVPVATQIRARAKAFIDGILKPLSIGVAGLILAGLGRTLPAPVLARNLAYVDLALILIWAWLLFALRREYLAALMNTLKKRRLDFSTAYRPRDDAATLELVRAGLASKVEAEVLAAIDLLPAIDGDFKKELTQLIRTGTKPIRLAALKRVAHGKIPDFEAIEKLLDDEDEEIKAAAQKAFQGDTPATQRLEDPDARVRASAVIELFPDERASTALAALMSSKNADERAEAARAIGAIPSETLNGALTRLLDDKDPAVKISALKAAARKRSRELVPALLRCLPPGETEILAIRALVDLCPDIEARLFTTLKDVRSDPAIRRRIPKIIGLAGGQAALDQLMELLDTDDQELLIAIARAAAKIRTRVENTKIDETKLDAAVRRELGDAYQLLAVLEDLALPANALLPEALVSRHRARLQVAFRLLGIRHPPKTIQLVYLNLDAENKAVRANALEVADNLLSKDESRLLFPLLEDRPSEDKVRTGAEMFPLERRSPEEWIRALLDYPHPWVVACALHHVGERGMAPLRDGVSAKLEAKDAVVRETATWALAKLG